MNEYKLRPIKFLWQLLNRTISEAKVYILGYRSYTALLNQTGIDAPVPTVLDNTLGNIVWTRDGNGEYYGTLTGAFGDGSKVFIHNPYMFVATKYGIYVYYNDSNSIGVSTEDYSAWNTSLNTDGILGAMYNVPIEIRVYNK